MKRIYSFMFAAVSIFAAASCQKEINEGINNGGDFTVTAISSADTKTALEGNTSYWTPGDKITVFNAEGAPVAFDTDITEKAASAKFTNTAEFTVPTSLVAVYPDRAKNQAYENGIITNFRVGGSQTAIAGSFDSSMAGAVGTPKEEGSTELVFTNIHCLIKFTIGGETAPKSVKLINNSGKMIAGLYKYDLANNNVINEGAAAAITLNGSFEVGKTYYIAAIPYDVKTTLTLQFDDKPVKTSGEVTLKPNKIYNLGTVQFAEEPEQPEKPELAFNVERVWGFYSTPDTKWWSGIAEGFKGSWFGGDTSIAMDDEYVYIPFGTATAGVYKVNIKTKEISTLPVDGISGGTYPTSCARMVKNTDPSVNGGKDILLVGNLAFANEPLNFYAYVNGTDSAPVQVYTLDAARRFGDKFTVSGTWQSGIIWLRSNQANPLEAIIPINNGKLQTWIDAYRITNADDNCISEISWYPVSDNTKADYCLMSTTSDKGVHLMSGCSTAGAATEYATYPALAKTFGYSFFEYDGEKYIAWTSLKFGNDKPRLQIIKGDGSSLASLSAALADYEQNLIAEFALSNETNDFNLGGSTASKSLCDCTVRVIGNEVYIAALGEECGLSLIKICAK